MSRKTMPVEVLDEAVATARELKKQLAEAEAALREIHQQATRKNRAASLKHYLVHDLDVIAKVAARALSSATPPEEAK